MYERKKKLEHQEKSKATPKIMKSKPTSCVSDCPDRFVGYRCFLVYANLFFRRTILKPRKYVSCLVSIFFFSFIINPHLDISVIRSILNVCAASLLKLERKSLTRKIDWVKLWMVCLFSKSLDTYLFEIFRYQSFLFQFSFHT